VLIVVEGVDGSGKSTLCDELAKRTGFGVYRRSQNLDGEMRAPLVGQSTAESQAEDRGAIEMAIAARADVIVDRGFVTEWVYGHVLRGEHSYDEWIVTQLDAKVAKAGFGVLLDFVHPADAWLRADDHVTPEQLVDLMERYRVYTRRSIMDWITLDATDSVEDNVRAVEVMMQNHHRRAA